MQVVYSDPHRAHQGKVEHFHGTTVPCFEKPERAEVVLAALTAADIGTVREPDSFPLAAIDRVHAPRYLRFLERAWQRWRGPGHDGDAMPDVWPIGGFRRNVEPDDFMAQLGLYSFDTGTPLTAGT